MKIGIENIESLIFEYHEGNLSDAEKAEVLNYIHNHPEYETEFTQWAQSYLHADPIKDYGLTNHLMQNPSTLWYKHTWVKIIAPTLVAALFSLFYFSIQKPDTASDSEKNKPVNKPETIDSNYPSAEKAGNAALYKTTIHTQQSKNNSIENALSNVSVTRNTQTSDSSYTHIHQQTNSVDATSDNEYIHKAVNTASDSIKINSAIKHAAPVKKEAGSKKKKPYKIKPSDKFLPTSTDF